MKAAAEANRIDSSVWIEAFRKEGGLALKHEVGVMWQAGHEAMGGHTAVHLIGQTAIRIMEHEPGSDTVDPQKENANHEKHRRSRVVC